MKPIKRKSASRRVGTRMQGKVYLTGQQGRGRDIVRCYICKRSDGNSLVFVVQKGKRSFWNAVKLTVNWFSARVFGVDFYYPLCGECSQLVASILRASRKSAALMKRAIQDLK